MSAGSVCKLRPRRSTEEPKTAPGWGHRRLIGERDREAKKSGRGTGEKTVKSGRYPRRWGTSGKEGGRASERGGKVSENKELLPIDGSFGKTNDGGGGTFSK